MRRLPMKRVASSGGTIAGARSLAPCLPDAPPAAAPKRPKRSHKAVRPQLPTRAQLDQRTTAARAFNQLAVDIENDLGGADQLSTIERSLIEAFTGATVTMNALNTKLVQGEAIDLGLHALVAGAMCRLASRLGISRRAKDVTPSLSEYLASKAESQ